MATSKAKIEPEILDDDDAEEMREELERSAADIGKLRKALIEERDKNARLREQLDERETRRGYDGYEQEHVIDFPGRLGRALELSEFPAVRVHAGRVRQCGVWGESAGIRADGGWLRASRAWRESCGIRARGANGLCIGLFLAWSLGQFRKRGLAQLLLKWAVFSLLWRCVSWCAAGLALVMVLTFTKISEWLGRQIGLRIWETRPVAIVKGWF